MATISIDLDDKATAGLQNLTAAMNKSSSAAEGLGESSAALNAEQQRQIVLLQRTETDWKTFGVSVAKSQMVVAELGLEIAKIGGGLEEFAVKAGLTVVGSLAKMAEMTVRYTLLTKGAVSVIGAFRGTSKDAAQATNEHGESLARTALKATAFGVVLTTLTGRWASVGEAATAVGSATVKSLAVVGPAAAAASISLAAYEAVMARTGKRTDELGNVTTNLDRVHEAASGLSSDIANVGSEMVGNLKSIALATSPVVTWIGTKLTDAWDDFDEVATRTADNNIKSLNNMREALSGLTTEQREATAKLEAQREKEKSAFEAIRKVNETLATQQKDRARTAEIASITTVDGIEREMVAVKQKASLLVGSAVSEKNLYAELNALDQQKTRLIEAEEVKRRTSLEKSLAMRKQYEEDYAKSQEAAQWKSVKTFQATYDQEKKILEEFYDFRRNLVFDARNEDFKTAEALIKQSGDEAKARANLLEGNAKDQAVKKAERDTELALHGLKMKNIDEELKQKLAAAKTEDDTRKAYYDYERKRATAEAEFNRQVMIQKLQDRQAETDRAIAIEKAKNDALKKAGADALEKAGVKGEDLLGAANKKDVRQVLQDQARERARQQVNADNGDLRKQAEFDTGGEAAQRLKRMQKQAQDAAAQDAAKQFARGKTDPAELANAQAQVVNQMLQGQQGQGKVADTTLKALQDLAAATAKTIAANADTQAVADKVAKDVANINGAADANAQRARAQAGSL